MSISMVLQNFSPIRFFSLQQMATESAESVAEETKQQKKVGKHIGDAVGGRDAPIRALGVST